MNRKKQVASLLADHVFDLLVIGGGATGCGVALDAASRGLNVLLVEKHDFSEGTSSRSTKLVHGGVRYLEKAVKHFDKEQYNLVREGLHERGLLLKNAPHLSNRVEFVTPLYSWIELPYVFAGLKFYDILSGKMRLGKSALLSKKTTLEHLPMLNSKGLKGGVRYYDGQFNDARMAISVAKTAVDHGANVVNHMEVVSLLKDAGKITGAVLLDRISGKELRVTAKGVINATGPFGDVVRLMDDANVKPILKASSGIHIVLDKKFTPTDSGLMIPETDDGRVIFVVPWCDHALVGTTDDPCEITEHPEVSESEIDYVLKQIDHYFKTAPKREDIKATWSGIRPLVFNPDAENTQELARTHVILQSASGLMTITGGKWTSYRNMSKDVVDEAVEQFGFNVSASHTETLKISGGENYNRDGAQFLAEGYQIDMSIATHLNRSYGSNAEDVLKCNLSGSEIHRLVEGHPYIESEVLYAATHEMAEHVVDFLIRRIPLGLLDQVAAKGASVRVLDIMAKYFDWDENRIAVEKDLIVQRLDGAI